MSDSRNITVRKIKPALPGIVGGGYAFPSEDGHELYLFNSRGQHLKTLNAFTGATLYTFGYDPSGRLLTITDGNTNITTFARDGQGNLTQIVSPFGQTTKASLDPKGYL